MKYFLFISLIVINVFAVQSKMPVQASEKAQYIYREFLPNREESFIIQATKCNPAKNELQLQKFESVSKVVDGTVNTLHIYITILSENVMVL